MRHRRRVIALGAMATVTLLLITTGGCDPSLDKQQRVDEVIIAYAAEVDTLDPHVREFADADEIFHAPKDSYTKTLLASTMDQNTGLGDGTRTPRCHRMTSSVAAGPRRSGCRWSFNILCSRWIRCGGFGGRCRSRCGAALMAAVPVADSWVAWDGPAHIAANRGGNLAAAPCPVGNPPCQQHGTRLHRVGPDHLVACNATV